MGQETQILNYIKSINETLNAWRANAKKVEELPEMITVNQDGIIMIAEQVSGVWTSKKLELRKIIENLSTANQDNKVREILLGTIDADHDLAYMLDNNGITVSPTELVILTALTVLNNQLVQRQFLWKLGKGEFNPIGSSDIQSKIIELQPKFINEIIAEELTSSPQAIVYDFGVITDDILDVLNSAIPARDYTDEEKIYYIRATKDGVNLLYNFIGINGIYGDGALQMTEDDLVLVYSSSTTDISTIYESKTDRGGYPGTSQGLANRIDLLENFKVDKAQTYWSDFALTGVVTDLEISTTLSTSLNFTNAITELNSIFFEPETVHPYDGVDFYIKNSQETSFLIKHEVGDIATTAGRYIFSFPDETDLEIQPNQVIHFKLNSLGGRGKIEFVGLNIDDSSLMHKTGDEEIDGNKIFLQPVTGVEATEPEHLVIKEQMDAALDLKLDAADYNDRFKGVYLTEAALNAAHPTANAGDSAQVNETGSTKVINYSWDAEESVWVNNGSGGSGATNTDALPEGTSNLYFTTARVLATALTGLSFLTGGAIVPTDSVLVAFGKIQKQINDGFTDSNIRSLLGITTLTGSNTGDQDLSGLQSKDTQVLVGSSTNVQNSWSGKTVYFTANCTITVPSTLDAAFLDFGFRTMTGVTVTWAITSPFTWETTPSTTPEKTDGLFTRYNAGNSIIIRW